MLESGGEDGSSVRGLGLPSLVEACIQAMIKYILLLHNKRWLH